MKTVAGILIAISSALLLNHAVYRMKVVVVTLPRIEMKFSWAVAKAFITNWPWLSAQIENMAGFVLYAVAVSLVPVSIVEPITAAGICLLVYLAIRQLGEKVKPRDYIAIGMTVLGVILISVSLERGVSNAAPDYNMFWIFAVVIMGLAAAIPLIVGRRSRNARAVAIAVSGGLLDGIASVFLRLTMINWGHDWKSTLMFLFVCVAAFVMAFILLQAGLQRGNAIVVAPVYNSIMEIVPIVVGMVALNESFPTINGHTDAFLASIRILAFVLILVGTVMLASRAEQTGELQPVEEQAGAARVDSPIEEPTNG